MGTVVDDNYDGRSDVDEGRVQSTALPEGYGLFTPSTASLFCHSSELNKALNALYDSYQSKVESLANITPAERAELIEKFTNEARQVALEASRKGTCDEDFHLALEGITRCADNLKGQSSETREAVQKELDKVDIRGDERGANDMGMYASELPKLGIGKQLVGLGLGVGCAVAMYYFADFALYKYLGALFQDLTPGLESITWTAIGLSGVAGLITTKSVLNKFRKKM